MKYHWHISGALLGLSLGLASWAAQEIFWIPERIAVASGPEQKDSMVAKDVSDRERRLSEREEILQDQLKRHQATLKEESEALESERKKLDQQFRDREAVWKKKISDLENQLKTKSEELEKTKSKRVENTRSIYEKMDPKSAAKILQEIEYDIAVKIISGMKEQKAAEILSKMNPEKARTITEINLGKLKKVSQPVNEVKEDNPIAPIGDQKK